MPSLKIIPGHRFLFLLCATVIFVLTLGALESIPGLNPFVASVAAGVVLITLPFDTISASICVYLIMGILWSDTYSLLEDLQCLS